MILWDNASYHASNETRAVVRALRLKVIYSGPYSYSAAPIELIFGGLKNRELNPDYQSTGKR